MDLGLADDPLESFKIFQGLIYAEYKRMTPEYKFITIDASQPPQTQQSLMREIVTDKIDLSKFKLKKPLLTFHDSRNVAGQI